MESGIVVGEICLRTIGLNNIVCGFQDVMVNHVRVKRTVVGIQRCVARAKSVGVLAG